MAKKREKGQAQSKGNGDGDNSPQISLEPVTGTAPETAAQPGAAVELNVLGQYIRDLSFESPGSPKTLQTPGENPQLQVSINVSANSQSDNAYEVALNLDIHAKNDAGVIYNVELAYAGLFRLRNLPAHLLQPILFVDCPALLFPFLRRILADVTRDGGFPPLLLDPIDFGKLYQKNLDAAQTQQPATN